LNDATVKFYLRLTRQSQSHKSQNFCFVSQYMLKIGSLRHVPQQEFVGLRDLKKQLLMRKKKSRMRTVAENQGKPTELNLFSSRFKAYSTKHTLSAQCRLIKTDRMFYNGIGQRLNQS